MLRLAAAALLVVTPAFAGSNPVLDAATAARADQLKLLEQVVDIDSGTGDVEGGRKVGAVFAARLKALGARVEMVAAEAPGLPENIVATVTGTGKTRILMIGHLDTVFGPGTVAQRPFRIDGDSLTGRARGPGVGVRRRDAPTLSGRKKCSPPRSSAVAWHLLSRHA